jgi:hypothetical protein
MNPVTTGIFGRIFFGENKKSLDPETEARVKKLF